MTTTAATRVTANAAMFFSPLSLRLMLSKTLKPLHDGDNGTRKWMDLR
jgi:hypothetical protein